MVMELSQKTLVVQSNRLIEAKYRLSVEEQKIIKILISHIKREDEGFKDYEFRLKDLAEMLGMGHKDIYRVLPKITERLMSRVLKFYNPDTQTLLQTSWLSSAEYRKGKGTVSLCFDPKLKPLLLQLQSYFTKYELGQVMQFKGQYTIRFFELRKSFLGRNKKEVFFSLSDLWEMLGLQKDEYKIFRDFKNRVLEPARIELLEKAEKSFSWEAVRQGRGGKVVGVRFTFDSETTTETAETREEQKEQKKLIEVKEDEKVEPHKESVQQEIFTDEIQQTLNELLRLGVGEKTARMMVKKHTIEQIKEKIELLKNQKKVENQAGFVISAIREDWHDEKAEREKQEQEARAVKVRVEIELSERKRQLRELKKRYGTIRMAMVEGIYEGLPQEEKQRLEDEFINQNPSIFGKLQFRLGFSNAFFRGFLSSKIPVEVPTPEEFLQDSGVILKEGDMELWKEI